MKMYSLLLFFVCLNLATVLVATTNAFPNPGVSSDDITSMSSMFTIETILAAGIGGVAALVGGILMQNVFLGAMAGILWVFGSLIAPIRWIVVGFPTLVSTVIKVMCANAGVASVETAVVSNLFLGIFTVMFSVVFFMFIMELFSQRYIT